jgi:hypothetical protein
MKDDGRALLYRPKIKRLAKSKRRRRGGSASATSALGTGCRPIPKERQRGETPQREAGQSRRRPERVGNSALRLGHKIFSRPFDIPSSAGSVFKDFAAAPPSSPDRQRTGEDEDLAACCALRAVSPGSLYPEFGDTNNAFSRSFWWPYAVRELREGKPHRFCLLRTMRTQT